jgi:MFS family permease
MFSLKSDGGIFYGWLIVAGCSLLTFYGAGTFFYGFTAFVHPMAKELGWSMALISGAFSLYRLESGIGAPLAGFLLDRIGPRILVFAGGLVWGAGFIYLSQAKTVFHFYAAFFVISFGWTFASGSAVPSALIGKWFIRKRGRALGLFTAICGFSGLFVPILTYLIDLYGWQVTLVLMGFFTWVFTTPISIALKHKPEDHGLLPDGKSSSSTPEAPITADHSEYREVDFSVGKALRTPSFWILSLTSTTFQLTMSALFVHLVPHLVSVGIAAQTASMTVMFITLSSVLGRAGFGWLSDFTNKKWLLIATFLLQGIGIFAFSRVYQVSNLIPFILAYAPSYGGIIVLRAAVAGEYYGRKNFGTIYGVLVGMGTFGGIAGPVIAGFAYDFYGDFRLVFIIFSLVSIFSALLLLFLKRPTVNSST